MTTPDSYGYEASAEHVLDIQELTYHPALTGIKPDATPRDAEAENYDSPLLHTGLDDDESGVGR